MGQWTNYTYDAQGQLIGVQLPALVDPDEQGPAPRATYTYEYNAQGLQTLIRDPLGHETRFTFDEQGRILSRTLPRGFGPDGAEETADDSDVTAGDFTETFAYDERGRIMRHVSFEGIVETTSYDPETGNIASKEFFDNSLDWVAENPHVTETYTYDAFGRKTETDHVDHLDSQNSRTESMTFNSQGQLASVSGPEGTIRYEYDDYGRIIRKTTGASPSDPVNDERYLYDSFSRLDKVTVYERNDVPLASNAREMTDYDYDLLGNLLEVTKPNGIIDKYGYNELDRLTSLVNYAPDSTPNDLTDNSKLAEYDYELRLDGKKSDAVEKTWIDGVQKTNTFHWEYDEDGRLTDEIFSSYDELLSQSEHFVFDLAGNRLSQEVDQGNDETVDKTTDYVYDANDRLVTETTGEEEITYGYDHTEQILKTTVNTTTEDILKTEEYTWTPQDRMATATITNYTEGEPSSAQKFEYGYDTNGIRTSAKVSTDEDGSGTFALTTTTQYLNDTQNFTGYTQVIEETTTDANGDPLSKVVYTIGLQRISQTTYDGDHPDGTSAFFLYDGHGSTRILADAVGALLTIAGVKQIFVYDNYGNLVNIQASQAGTTFLYSGEQFDWRTGMQNLRARLYQINSGRFISLDSYSGDMLRPLSLSKYLYTLSDPINGVDPSGCITIFSPGWGYAVEDEIEKQYKEEFGKNGMADIQFGGWARYGKTSWKVFRAKPDILDRDRKIYMEIKPFSPSGITAASYQMGIRAGQFFYFGIFPDINWVPKTRIIYPDGYSPCLVFNVLGVLFNTDMIDLLSDVEIGLVTFASARALLNNPKVAFDAVIALEGRVTEMARLVISSFELRSHGQAVTSSPGVRYSL